MDQKDLLYSKKARRRSSGETGRMIRNDGPKPKLGDRLEVKDEDDDESEDEWEVGVVVSYDDLGRPLVKVRYGFLS